MTFSLPIRSNVVAARQPDITIPIFEPSYTMEFLTVPFSPEFSAGSFWPLIDMTTSRGAGIIYDDLYTCGPFGWGTTKINKPNIGTPYGDPTGGLLWGNLLFKASDSGGNGIGTTQYSVFPMAAGVDNVSIEFDRNWNGLNFNNGFSSFTKLGLALGMTTTPDPTTLEPLLCFSRIYYQDSGNSQSYIAQLPVLKPNLLQLDMPYSLFQGESLSAILPGNQKGSPELNTGFPQSGNYVDWFCDLDGVGNSYLGPIVSSANTANGLGWQGHLSFDNPTISSVLLGSAVASTAFGFLFTSSNTSITGQATKALMSRDGTQYAMIKLAPQDAASAALAPFNLPFTIDPSGIAYLLSSSGNDSGGTGKPFNSFAIDLPWASVLAPNVTGSLAAIPGLCGCQPPHFGVTK